MAYIMWDSRKWYFSNTPGSNPYPRREERGVQIRLHREVWRKAHGDPPAGWCVHHVDGDKRNNALENLVLLPQREHKSHHGKQRSEAQRGVAIRVNKARIGKSHASQQRISRACGQCGCEVRVMWPRKLVYCPVCRKKRAVLATKRYKARVRTSLIPSDNPKPD